MRGRGGPAPGARRWPCKVRVATSDADRGELVSVRAAMLTRDIAPLVLSNLRVAEKQDTDQDAILLLARSKVERSGSGFRAGADEIAQAAHGGKCDDAAS